jgi:hypothetical protein
LPQLQLRITDGMNLTQLTADTHVLVLRPLILNKFLGKPDTAM